jgi:hypothetical protein
MIDRNWRLFARFYAFRAEELPCGHVFRMASEKETFARELVGIISGFPL